MSGLQADIRSLELMPAPAEIQAVTIALDIVKVVLGGVVAAGITLWVSGRRQDQDRHRAARHLAIRLIDIFERFAIGCADAISSNRSNHRDNPYDFSGITYLPDLGTLPSDDIGWRGIEPAFSIEAQTFDNRIQGARGFIRGTGEHGDADDVENEVNRQAIWLAKASWNFASGLRTAYRLSHAMPPYDIEAFLVEEDQRQERNDKLRREESAEFWAEQMAEEDARETKFEGNSTCQDLMT